MPNTLQSKVNSKLNTSSPPRIPQHNTPESTSQHVPQPPQHMQPHGAAQQHAAQRMGSASSSQSSGNRSAVTSAFGAATMDSNPEQHALNSLDGLHAQTGLRSSSATGLPMTRTAPSRGNSSLSSSRAGSAFPFDDEAEAVANALTLQGMSLT